MTEEQIKYHCARCNGLDIHEIELNTAVTNPRFIIAKNNKPSLSPNELPKYLSGFYCGACEGFQSVIRKLKGVKL